MRMVELNGPSSKSSSQYLTNQLEFLFLEACNMYAIRTCQYGMPDVKISEDAIADPSEIF